MIEIVMGVIDEYRAQVTIENEALIGAQRQIDRGECNAFVELGHRNVLARAAARIVVLQLKIETLESLLERMKQCRT